MDIRERIEAFWAGERPDRIPYTIYHWEWEASGCKDDAAWHAMFEDGLGVTFFLPVAKHEVPGLEERNAETREDGVIVRRHSFVTPVGEVYETSRNDWHHKYLVETPADYRVMTWIAEHTVTAPAYEEFDAQARAAAPYCIVIPRTPRTPLQEILVDLVGLENFGLHLFEYPGEIMALYQALLKKFRRSVEIAAGGPGHYVEVLENFTAETLGPKRYEKFLAPVYRECFKTLHDAGKIVGTHYDGKTASCKNAIASAPIDLIESLTPPPEGDQTLAQCRAAWPTKLFWSNINVALYQLPPKDLKRVILERVREGAPDGRRLAFEVSEHLSVNWRESMPVVLDALNETRSL
jgi:hypothetical protein